MPGYAHKKNTRSTIEREVRRIYARTSVEETRQDIYRITMQYTEFPRGTRCTDILPDRLMSMFSLASSQLSLHTPYRVF